MINDDLLRKFDRIEDLPVSEEMLGAYLEGKTTPVETMDINSYISESIDLQSFISRFSSSEEGLIKFSEYEIDFSQDSFFSDVFENIESMKDLTRAYNTIGEDGQNLQDSIFIQQPDDHSCALRSQQIVLRDFGIDIPFDKLEELAKAYGVYSDEGTCTYDIGKVLQIAGVGMHQVQGTSLYDLTNELAQGHRVIVSVDADELWYTDSMSKLKNWFNDAIGNQGGNHALIVAGVEVNPLDANDVKVVLTDPGAGHLRVEYPLDQFMDAWKDSKCFMAATNTPAPYQYDAETGKEIPSNFMVEQYVNDFIANNGYQLNPDLINIPEDYHPSFTGHVEMVGDLTYADWESRYDIIVNSRMPSSLSIKEQIEELAKDKSRSLATFEHQGEDKTIPYSDLNDVHEDNTLGSLYFENEAHELETPHELDGSDSGNFDYNNYDDERFEEKNNEPEEDDVDENDDL